jgi:hypothetical protein
MEAFGSILIFLEVSSANKALIAREEIYVGDPRLLLERARGLEA